MNWKNLVVSAITALVVVVLAGVVGGNDQSQPATNFGSGTRFPSGISADSTSPSAGEVRGSTLTITSSPTFGTANSTTTLDTNGFFCLEAVDEGGRVVYVTLATSGNEAFATSTSPCDA